ncbi:MAG TPA: DUF1259 domain-containing protein [Usitatibacter sp.]|nr:DUF1259 domain-containing protein [Usitatibacter sp.]
MSRLLVLVATSLFVSATFAAEEAPWMGQVAQALGKKGSAMPGGVYRVGLARSDIKATLDGVELKPAFALGSWLAFSNAGNHGTVMGDLVLLPAEVNPVMSKLQEGGIQITALHNHLLRNEPFTMYMHVMGHGEPAKLAAVLHDALQASKTPLADSPAGAPPAALDLDTAAVDKALGHKGKVNGGVYQVSIPRAEKVRDGGMEVPEAMGAGIGINFQPTGNGKSAITGDFVLTAREVNPVLKDLRDNGIEVTAVHNHMLDDQPRLFFVHFWANDDTSKLLAGLHKALSDVSTAKK